MMMFREGREGPRRHRTRGMADQGTRPVETASCRHVGGWAGRPSDGSHAGGTTRLSPRWRWDVHHPNLPS